MRCQNKAPHNYRSSEASPLLSASPTDDAMSAMTRKSVSQFIQDDCVASLREC